MNFWDRLFGRKAKDKVKNHQSCNFGVKEFNKSKRSKAFVQEIRVAEEKRGRGKIKNPVPPPPTPPPPTSNPPGVLLLVFSGTTVTGTSWNYAGDIVCEHSGLTIEEQAAILAHIAGDYAGFNVIVTADQAVYNNAPVTRRSKIVFTESWEWYGQAGGVAFVNSFGDSQLNVGFVFSSLLGYNLKFVSEAGSHEAGHQLGCYHQCLYDAAGVKVSEYNTGADGQAPIMGVAYYQPDGKWWIGKNSFGNMQDDANIIRNKLQ